MRISALGSGAAVEEYADGTTKVDGILVPCTQKGRSFTDCRKGYCFSENEIHAVIPSGAEGSAVPLRRYTADEQQVSPRGLKSFVGTTPPLISHLLEIAFGRQLYRPALPAAFFPNVRR